MDFYFLYQLKYPKKNVSASFILNLELGHKYNGSIPVDAEQYFLH